MPVNNNVSTVFVRVYVFQVYVHVFLSDLLNSRLIIKLFKILLFAVFSCNFDELLVHVQILFSVLCAYNQKQFCIIYNRH